MSNGLPTPAQLIERLRAVYEAETGERLSDEKLAGRLPISLSTFNRWKKGDTRAFREIVAMLDTAGWLSIDEDVRALAARPRDRLGVLEARVAELPTAEDLGQAVATLQAAIDRLASRGSREVQPVKPARKRGAQ